MKWLKWLSVVGMFAVGFGAVFVSTGGLGDTQAATTGFLTQVASRTDVSKTSAATGTVSSAATYALAFGEDARPADDSTSAGTADTEWLVADVLVSVGDRVSTGQVLATASSADVEQQIADATTSLDLARMKLSEAGDALEDARTQARRDLVDAKTAVQAAKYSLTNARVERNDAADGNPMRRARIAVIQAQDQLRAATRLRDDLKTELDGDFPEQRIALGEAEATVADLETQIADLTEQLELARILAPIDGVVSSVNIKAGFVAPASDAILIDSATLEVIADVVESDISSLALGQTAMVTIDALDLDVPGTVTSIAPSTDGGTSSVVTFPVTVTLQEPDLMVKPGMSSDVEITIAEAPGSIAVPAVALRGRQGSYTVEVANENGGTETRQVTVGLVTETLAEIQAGLAEGEAVVVGTSAARAGSADEQAGGFGGPGGFGGIRVLEGGGGFRPDRGGDGD